MQLFHNHLLKRISIFPLSMSSYLSLGGFISKYFVLFIALFTSHCLDYKSFILNDKAGQWQSLAFALLFQYCVNFGEGFDSAHKLESQHIDDKILITLLGKLQHLDSFVFSYS